MEPEKHCEIEGESNFKLLTDIKERSQRLIEQNKITYADPGDGFED